MKRTPMPRPSKPLPVHKPLQRGCGLNRTGGLNPVSDKRRAQQPERARRVNALREAQAGRCARCGERRTLHGHERLGMAQGASYIHPDVAVCDPCNGAIEDKPRVSAWNGWKISSRWPHDPALQPWEARSLDGAVVDLRALVPETEEASA